MARLRVGVIGYGSWGRVHLDAYMGNPRTELVALLGRDPQRTAAAAAVYGAAPYTDLERFLAADLDLVSVVLPDQAHFAPTMAVLRAGISCFAEKPLAMDLAEGRALLAIAEERGVPFGINFNHRYTAAIRRALDMVESRAVGDIAYILWKFTGGHFPERQPSLAHLIYMQCHGFNMLEVCGGPVKDVACVASDPRGIGSLTTAAVTMHFQRGGIGTLLASVDASYAYPHVHMLEIAGLRGRIVVDDAVGSCAYHRAGSATGEVWQPSFFDDGDRSFAASTARHIDAFVEALLRGEPVPIPATEGYAALVLACAAIRASSDHRTVQLSESPYNPSTRN